MKIFHITDHLPNYHKVWGGAEQVAYRYIKLETEQEIELSEDKVIVGTVKPTKSINENFLHRRIRVMEDFFPESVQVYITGIKNRIFPFDPISFFHLLQIFKLEKPDIVHFHKFNKISFSAILAAKVSGAKTVLSMYDYWYLCPGGMLIDGKRNSCRRFHGEWCKDCDAVSDFRFLLPLIALIRRPIFDFFLDKIDAFAVLSNSLGRLLIEFGISKERIFLVRQIFETPAKKQRQSKSERKEILFVGWIDSRKGPDIAIKAFNIILKIFPKTKLYMIGEALDKKYEEEIKIMIKKLKLENNIILLGKIPPDEVAKYFQKCEVLLLPEQWENMSPVVLVEAMNYGTPVVASNIGGLSEFIKDGKTGFLVDREKTHEFAKKVILLLSNKKLADKMGNEARKDILKICDPDEIYKNLMSLYQWLIFRKGKNKRSYDKI